MTDECQDEACPDRESGPIDQQFVPVTEHSNCFSRLSRMDSADSTCRPPRNIPVARPDIPPASRWQRPGAVAATAL